jgi:hypothetical protein
MASKLDISLRTLFTGKLAVFKKLFKGLLDQGLRHRALEYDSYPTPLLRPGFCHAR